MLGTASSGRHRKRSRPRGAGSAWATGSDCVPQSLEVRSKAPGCLARRPPSSPPAPRFPTGRPRLRLGLRGLAAGPDQWRAASSRLCAEGRRGQLKGRGGSSPSRSLSARSPALAPAPALTPPGRRRGGPAPGLGRAPGGFLATGSSRQPPGILRGGPGWAGPGRAGGGERKPTRSDPPPPSACSRAPGPARPDAGRDSSTRCWNTNSSLRASGREERGPPPTPASSLTSQPPTPVGLTSAPPPPPSNLRLLA